MHNMKLSIPPVNDLRSALAYLQQVGGQYIETDHPVDPKAELAGVYKRIGAGGTVESPTQIGPAMIFNNIIGYPGSRVLVGLMASRQRASILLGAKKENLSMHLAKAVKTVIEPILVDADRAPCQEEIYYADDPSFDIRKLLPAPTMTEEDAGPFFCLGLVLGSSLDGKQTDVTIHRLCVQGRDELSIYFAPNRHIDQFRQEAENAGKALPVSINMGLDPAITLAHVLKRPLHHLALTNYA